MTDNGSAYRSHHWRQAGSGLALRTSAPGRNAAANGKAERFIQTSLREWAYERPFASSHERTAALLPWLEHYNTARPHAALAHQPPTSRLHPPSFLGSTEATVPSVPTCHHPRPVRRGGARSAAGDRRQPARSVLAPTRRTHHPRTGGSPMLVHMNNLAGNDT